jgi:hypothetical protein
MEPGARFSLPVTEKKVSRNLYFYRGSSIEVDGTQVENLHAVELKANEATEIVNGEIEGFLILLQGQPIAEPIAQYGPFVMNTQAEIQKAFDDYRKTQFGGWPWPRRDQVHPLAKGRFAAYSDGHEEVRD